MKCGKAYNYVLVCLKISQFCFRFNLTLSNFCLLCVLLPYTSVYVLYVVCVCLLYVVYVLYG